jgi:subtilase family serine protease
MIRFLPVKSRFLRSVTVLTVCLVVAQPILAERPPDGYARPPIHVKGNATSGPKGYTPTQVRHAYGFDTIPNQGQGQTIAIVDAYDDPNIASDLAKFQTTFGIGPCNFQKVYAAGSKPKTDAGWSLEIALDVEWACAIAPLANIVLVEAASNSFANLLAAVDVAVGRNASVVSMSWGGGEFSSETAYDSHFNINGVTFTASSGDSGSGVEYPAASPWVVAVGGTTLKLDPAGNVVSETAWSGSGGGISVYEGVQSWQASQGSKRGIPDVAYDADPNTGFPVYDSVRYQGQAGWFQVGGTSAGAPQWAAFIALVNSGRAQQSPVKPALSGTASPIYGVANSNTITDITSGSNGSCGAVCTAVQGYDYVTGLGSPIGSGLYNALQ